MDLQPAGGTNSPNLGVLTATKTIQNLVMNDAADWFKFQTQGVGTTANSLTVSFDPNAGDMDLTLYRADGATVVRSAANDFGVGNASPETISLAGVPVGTYYAVVTPHTAGFGIANYTLQITPPAATGDDPYEPNSDKATVDGDTAGGTNSPNLGVLTATKTIQNLVMNDAADWFKFQTQGVGTTANSVTVSFDPNAGDMDLTLYRARRGDGGAVGGQRLRRRQCQPRDDQPRRCARRDLLRGGHPSHRGLRHRQLHPPDRRTRRHWRRSLRAQ